MRITLLTLALPALTLTGCGTTSPCGPSHVQSVTPTAASADHLAKAPDNQQHFQVLSAPVAATPGCAVPQFIELLPANWTVSDPIDVTISSAPDATNGLATCLSATDPAATVTATFGSGTQTQTLTATLTCK